MKSTTVKAAQMTIGFAFVIGYMPANAQNSSTASQDQKQLTTQQAAEAKKREGKTGTSNANAANQLKDLEDEERRQRKAQEDASKKKDQQK